MGESSVSCAGVEGHLKAIVIREYHVASLPNKPTVRNRVSFEAMINVLRIG